MKGSSWASGSVGLCDQMWTALVDVRGEAEAGSLGSRWDQVYILHSFPPRALLRWGRVSPSMVQNEQSKEAQTKGGPRELVAEGVFQACFQHSILIETNTSPFVGWGLEMHVYV